MEFGWINLFGACVVILIMVPNIIYAFRKNVVEENHKISRILTICEQIGRYSCICLMCLPLFVWKFGFGSVSELMFYILGNAILLIGYYIFWIVYIKSKSMFKALMLAIIPTMIFLLSGILLQHWVLVLTAILFGYSHCRITYITHK